MSPTSSDPTRRDGSDPVPEPATGPDSRSAADAGSAAPVPITEAPGTGSGGASFTGLQTLRPGSSIAVGVAALAAGLALGVPTLLSTHRSWPLISGVVLALVLVWLYVVRPHVKLHDEGVRIVNPLRTIDITWPMITGVRSRWTLELLAGPKKYTAWGVPADPKRPRYGRGLLSLGANKVMTGQQAESAPTRPKIEAQTVAAEIESRVAADRKRKDGRTPRILQGVWDPAPVGLLLASLAFFAIAVLL